jgi:hypothetical protein
MVDDVGRRMLFETLETSLGRKAASRMMELMPEVEWSEIARRSDVEAMGLALRAEMSELRGEVRGEIGTLRGEFGELRGEFGDLRGEMKAMGARLALTNMATSMTIAGLVLSAVKLL